MVRQLEDLRACHVCGLELPPSAFAVDRSKASGRKSICVVCDRAKARRYYATHREARLAAANARNARRRAERAASVAA